MKKSFMIVLCLTLAACNQKEKPVNGEMPFFIFDKVEYYHTGISANETDSIVMKQDKTRKEEGLLQIIRGRIPVSTIDTLFIKNMELLSFEKYSIDAKLNPQIAQLFSVHQPKTKATETKTNSPTYTDVLIFRKKDKVIGVAKICFDCKKSWIMGSRYPTEDFGLSGEYEELHQLLASIAKPQ
ncbi:hypothetical protein [Flavobacterium sp. XGLA_31]|uniref:hypothetical protein n=1 Tax=Flavobacterium sp. XGLA_31 TaxID=3447666 RepID=UPI003F37EF92